MSREKVSYLQNLDKRRKSSDSPLGTYFDVSQLLSHGETYKTSPLGHETSHLRFENAGQTEHKSLSISQPWILHITMERRPAFRFHTLSSLMIAGPLGCSKTVFTTKLLLDNTELFSNSPKAIHYYYGSWQEGVDKLEKGGVKFHEGIPDSDALPKWFPEGGALVLDDLMDEGGNDKCVLDLFTKHLHHQNITVIYLCQDLFLNGKFTNTISRNAHYIVAFKNPRDQLGMRNLLLQSFPTRWQEVLETFRKVTERPFGYMLLDLHSTSQDDQCILSHLLKEEGCMRCHQFKTPC